MYVHITTIVDNIAQKPSLLVEHGLALWIDVEGTHVLFDTGQGAALAHNANALGVSIPTAHHIVLSHGHYDHSGGLDQAMAMAPQATVWIHPEATRDRYSIRESGQAHAIGMPEKVRKTIELDSARIHWTREPTRLTSEIGMTGSIPRETDFEDAGGAFFLDVSGRDRDDIVDDQALWVVTPSGIVVVTGCAHSGVINTVRYILKINPERRLRAVIGGLHLVQASAERLAATAAALREMAPTEIHSGHCTGGRGLSFLRENLRGVSFPLQAGSVIRFE
jgi:7,8-dihydropterin-6-yl-methyl-4-(beta-D-ribofuranosyl)aminobenzene 5'-phosphate synthase